MKSHITSRMRWIVKQMEQGALIYEVRDTFNEVSTYILRTDRNIIARVSEPVLDKLYEAGLITEVRRIERRNKRGEFVTTTDVYGLKE